MPDNVQNVTVTQNTWVDLYAVTGFAVGTQLAIENVGDCDVYLAIQAAQPVKNHDAYNVIKRPPSVIVQNQSGDTGAWAYCQGGDGKLAISTPSLEGFLPVQSVRLLDGYGAPISSLKGAIDIHDADVHNSVVNRIFHQHNTAIQTTLAAATAPGDYQMTVVDPTGFNIGDSIHIDTTSFETTHPVITNIVGSVFTLDRRLDVSHQIGDTITMAIINMASQAGTLAVPQEYAIWPEPGLVFHITRIIFSMTHTTAGDLGLFGNLTKLTNGVLVRARLDGIYYTFTNWKTNSDIKSDMFDVEFDTRSSGGGTYGTSGRGTFAKLGTVVRLDGDTDDRLEIYIQDDLTTGAPDLLTFTMKAQGHLEGF